MKKSKIWGCGVLSGLLVLLVLGAGITGIIDPFFHYHGPVKGLSYPLSEQRYQNDGIIRHLTYDALITGTSMTENFLASEFDALFGVLSIKVPFSGATFKEIDDNICRALERNPELKTVARSLDGYMLAEEKDSMRTDAEYPEYLYDDSLWNDVSYVLNKEILLRHTVRVLQYTVAGQPGTSFDAYSYWGDTYDKDPGRILKNYHGDRGPAETEPLDERERQRILENVEQNVVATAKANPDVEFYCFYPPYSIYWWFSRYENGTLEKQIESYRIATEQLLQCENIHLFSFTGEYDYITRLENYLDPEHYGADMNSAMLRDMQAGENLLTLDNWEAHWDELERYFMSFDYGAHFAEYGYPPEGA